jgi:hypothetical protein
LIQTAIIKPPNSFSWFSSLLVRELQQATAKNPLVSAIKKEFNMITAEFYQKLALDKAINSVDAISNSLTVLTTINNFLGNISTLINIVVIILPKNSETLNVEITKNILQSALSNKVNWFFNVILGNNMKDTEKDKARRNASIQILFKISFIEVY